MWARIGEILLGCWLAMSPFIFHYPPNDAFLRISDFICAILVILFAVLSFRDRFKRMHLWTLIVALWIWGLGYSEFPLIASLPQENSVLVGLTLLMLAIVPSHSHRVSPSWQKFKP